MSLPRVRFPVICISQEYAILSEALLGKIPPESRLG
jgi:hypothetical protein